MDRTRRLAAPPHRSRRRWAACLFAVALCLVFAWVGGRLAGLLGAVTGLVVTLSTLGSIGRMRRWRP